MRWNATMRRPRKRAASDGGRFRRHEWFSYLRIVSSNFVFFAINDGSKDETAKILASLRAELGPRLRVVNKTNSGHGLTCREGYELALAEGTEWIFQIDSDGQCDPV